MIGKSRCNVDKNYILEQVTEPQIAAYYLTEEVDDGVRFKVMKCYSSPDAAVLEIVILIDTTPDRDRGVFYALQAFGDDDSEDF